MLPLTGDQMTSEHHHVAVIDVAKVANLVWAIEGPLVNESGDDVDRCIEVLAQSMQRGPLGAALLRLKWTDDPNVLCEPCLVVRYQGE